MGMPATSIPILPSIGALAGASDAWIVDVWGVMHNGQRAYAAACEACRRFRAGGGGVAMLSNAPRPFAAVARQLEQLGVPRDAYDFGVTSGDMARAMIADMVAGEGCGPLLHIGPERDKGLFEGLAVSFAEADAAGLVVCSGLFDDTRETPADYRQLFAKLRARGVPMICANPDIKVERGDALVYCAGALAQDYAAGGGRVAYTGKPHAAIYEHTLKLLAEAGGRAVARERVLAIGDGIDTDLKGAYTAGLPSVLIASAVHLPQGLSPAALARLFAERPFAPLAALPALAW
jgi:HAD superfamily hydrolase (TIGR01459 family)